MKARRPQLTSKQRKLAQQEIDILIEKAWREKEDKITIDLTRRILKTFIFVMYTEFGWGAFDLFVCLMLSQNVWSSLIKMKCTGSIRIG